MMRSPRRHTLRAQLIMLVLATLLPMLGFAAATILWSARQQRDLVKERAIEIARALLSAVDRELLGTVGALELLAASPNLNAPDLAAFRRELPSVLEGRRAWLSIRLATPDGRTLLDPLTAPEAVPPPDRDIASLARAVRTRRPAVGDIVAEPPDEPTFRVRVPVLRQERVVSVLSAVLRPTAVGDILGQQRIPADWVGSILDARHVHVARTGAAEPLIGHAASPELIRAVERASEGWLSARTPDGDALYAAYSRSPWSGWSVALGIPPVTVDAPLHRSLLGLAAGGIAAALAAVVLAALLGRRLATPITALAKTAPSIVQGVPVVVPPGAPAEVATLAGALAEAAAERSRAEAELRRTDRLLQAIFEGTTDAVYVKDLEGRYVMINTAGARLLGRRPEEVVGKADPDLFAPESARRLQLQDRKLIQGGVPLTLENRDVETTGGERRTYLATKIPYRDADGRVIGVMGITRDITERQRGEEERARALERAEAAWHEAELANRAKDEFLAILSHELRTPLNAVYGWARMLRGGQLGPDVAARAVEVIERNAAVQLQLIEDLLDVSRIISGKIRLEVRPLDLSAVVVAAVDSVRPAADAKSIRLGLTLDPAAGAIVGDPDRLQQVVWNLVSNAVKFTPPGGDVRVELRGSATHSEIVVSDTGEGIAAELLPFVFDRFRQADSSSTRAHGGLGLGLALVRHLVELHGGTVRAESEGPGRGARFSVTLPISDVAAVTLRAAGADSPHPWRRMGRHEDP